MKSLRSNKSPRLPRPFALAAASLVPFALLCTTPRAAHAAGFLADQFGSDHGQPALPNTYSVYFNPAAMAGMQTTELTLGGVIAARSLGYNRDPASLSPSCLGAKGCSSSDPTYVQANTGQATLFNALAAPFLGFVTDFGGSNMRLGIASYVPFGGQVTWQNTGSIPGAPGATDGPQRWASISNTTSSLYETAAFAYRIPSAHLGIGLSVSAIRSAIQNTQAHNLDGSDDVLTGTNAIKEGRAFIDVSGWQVGAAAGLYWEATPTLRLGASYTSQPNFGTMRLSGSYKQWQQTAPEIKQNVDFVEAYPDIIRLGAAWRVASDLELRLDGSWQRWSQFKNQCVVVSGQACTLNADGSATSNAVLQNVPRNFQDAYKIRLGGADWVQPETEIFGSGAFETSASKTSYDDPLIFDANKLYGTLGLKHSFTRHFYGQAAYTYVYYIPVTVSDSALASAAKPSKLPNEDGSYTSSLYVLDVALGYVF
jgi:long-chain fatty acid transport protein